ncbi:MAG: hypothetical protein KDK74_06075 [Cephaloticoccus sp.]|nr:hypothetical protein [Cephaloticoccus sp.]
MSRLVYTYGWMVAGMLLAAIKLWFTRGQAVYAIGSAGLDDRLFLELAQHILRGDWLGPYTALTLAKGPAYPLFIAACAYVEVPLFAAQHLFYIMASFAIVAALAPVIRSPILRFALFALLLCNPMTFDAPGMGRVLRQHIYGPLALLIFAGLIALYLRKHDSFRRNCAWMLLLGLAGGAFYLTREETVWILPGVAVLTSACLIGAWRISTACLHRTLGLLAVACLTACLPLIAVSTLNKIHYGWFGTCEFRATAFKDAYGAMTRVQAGPQLPYVPVTREARVAMARASSAFAEIQTQFDLNIARAWAGHSEFFTGIAPTDEQIGGGWFIWALREAVAKAGHAHSAAESLAFYRRLADEINEACETGELAAGPARSGFAPNWQDGDVNRLLRSAGDFIDFVVRFRHFNARTPPSVGTAEEIQLFQDLTGERLQPPAGALVTADPQTYLSYAWRVEALQTIGQKLRHSLFGLLITAQIITLLGLVVAVTKRRWTFPLTLAASAWGACAASILIHAAIQATSFPVKSVTSFAPIYPLLLLFVFAAAWDAVLLWRQHKNLIPNWSLAWLDSPRQTPSVPETWRTRGLLPGLLGLTALAPLLIWFGEFKKLFWFGDDLYLLDQLAYMGFWDWTGRVFAENFVPLFKFFWGGFALTFNGSYLAMLWLLWLTHAANTALFARWLRQAGLSASSIILCSGVFALTPANLETLGWSVQWSAVLATNFLLLALWWFESHRDLASRWSWKLLIPLILFSAASACSFSRGVLTGGVIAAAFLLPLLAATRRREWLPRTVAALACLAPAVMVALTIMSESSGNHHHLAGTWMAITQFAAGYFLFNPAHAWVYQGDAGTVGWLLLAAFKLTVVIAGFACARGRMRPLLLLLLIYDLGNATLLGIGRHHTGMLAALSSRYQYSALLATLPFVACIVDSLLLRIASVKARRTITISTGLALLVWCFSGWPGELRVFCSWRGSELRELLAAPAVTDPSLRVPALDYMHVERAKALRRAFNLH